MTTCSSVRMFILELCKTHGVSTLPAEYDAIIDAIGTLSDNDITKDEPRQALVNLRRAGIIKAPESHRLLFALIDEENGIKNV